MPTLNIGGKRVQVGDNFMSLSPEQQNATVDEIARSFGEDNPAPPPGMVMDPRTGQMVDTRAQAEIQRRQGGFMQRASDVAGQMLSGLPFVGSYLDEGAGAIAGATGGNADLQRERARAQLQTYQEANPKTAAALQIAGGIGGSIPMAAMGGPALAARAPASLGAKMLAGAGVGAGAGAVEGAVSGYGAGTEGNRGSSAALGAGVGGVLGGAVGGAIPAIATGGNRLISGVLDRATTQKKAARQGLSREAHTILNRAMEADGSLGSRGTSNLMRAGDDAMLADAGPNARTLLDTAIQRSGKAGVAAKDAIEARGARANQTVRKALDDAFGRPAGANPSTSYSGETSRMYRKAYEQPVNYADPRGMDIEEMVKTRVPPEAVKAANALMRVNRERSKQILANFADDGTVTFETLPDVRQLDYITRGLNQVAEVENGKGKIGGQTPVGRAYAGLAKEIRDKLKELVPDYKVALDRASTEIGKKQARDFGADVFSAKVSRADLDDFIRDAPAVEVEKLKEGIRQQFDDALANVTRTLTDPNVDAREAMKAVKSLSSRSAREKMSTILGPDQAGRFMDQFDRATASLELRAGVRDNSRTYARLAMDRTIKDRLDGGSVGALAEGRPLNAGQRLIQELTGRTPDAKLAIEDKVYEDIVKALTSRRGSDAQQTLRALQDIASRSPKNAAAAKAAADRIALSLGLGVYQTGTRSVEGR